MGTRTVYVKNEELWKTAQSMAGKSGLSGFVEEALERLITVKRQEQNGLERIRLPIVPADQTEEPEGHDAWKETLEFDGKRLVKADELSVYITKAGNLIVTDDNPWELDSIYGYRKHETFAALRNDEAILRLEKGEQSLTWNLILRRLPPSTFTTWED